MGVKVTTLGTVFVDVLINALVRDGRELVFFQIARDLFGRPILAQEGFDLLESLWLDACSILFCLATILGL